MIQIKSSFKGNQFRVDMKGDLGGQRSWSGECILMLHLLVEKIFMAVLVLLADDLIIVNYYIVFG